MADKTTTPRTCLPILNHSSFFGSFCSPQCLPPPAFTPLPSSHSHHQSTQLSLPKDNSSSSMAIVLRTPLYQVLSSSLIWGWGGRQTLFWALCAFRCFLMSLNSCFFSCYHWSSGSTSSPPPPLCCRSPSSAFLWKRNNLLFSLSYSYFECLSLTNGRIK